jgi:hypothetical protein
MSDFNQRQTKSVERRTGQTEVKEVPIPNIGASVYRTANQSINSAANTAIQFDNEEQDTSAFHDNVTNNTRLTVPYAGTYAVWACVQFAAAGGNLRYIFFGRNGLNTAGNLKGLALQQVALAGQVVALVSSAKFVNLSAGDYIELFAFQDSGGALNVTPQAYAPWFQIHYLA